MLIMSFVGVGKTHQMIFSNGECDADADGNVIADFDT